MYENCDLIFVLYRTRNHKHFRSILITLQKTENNKYFCESIRSVCLLVSLMRDEGELLD